MNQWWAMSRVKFTLSAMFLAALALAAGATPSRANLVTNGGFDSGLSGWTSSSSAWAVTDGRAILTDCDGCSLSQTITTTIGETYSLSFLYNPGNSSASSIKVDWGNYYFQFSVTSDEEWNLISYPYLLNHTATSNSLTIVLSGYSTGAFIGLDNIEVLPVVTPIPAALPLFASGGAGLVGFVSWRRKRKALAGIAPAVGAATA